MDDMQGSPKRKLFILGAGFSKEFSPEMPLVSELAIPGGPLATAIEKRLAVPHLTLLAQLLSNPELLLTYLMPMPWKSLEEDRLHRWLFERATRLLAEHLVSCEERAFKSAVPQWAIEFVQYLHSTKATVATLNYDTVLERVADEHLRSGDGDRIPLDEWYQGPIVDVRTRTGVGLWGGYTYDTFTLLKLHGSINWHFAGDPNVGGQPVYFVPIGTETSKSPRADAEPVRRVLTDLVPVMIPPVLHKGEFYGLGLLKTMWHKFVAAVYQADEVYVIGYSLPLTDLVMRLALAPLGNAGKRVYIVNNASNVTDLSSNYLSAIGNGDNIDNTYLRSDAIPAMVRDLREAAGLCFRPKLT